MKKKFSFTIIILMSCLAILLGVVMKFPQSVHASMDIQLHHASKSTITVSPTILDLSQCSSLNVGNSVLCPVTLTVNQPGTNRLHWTSSYSATLCQENICGPDYYVAILPSQGSLNAVNSSVQVSIIVSDYCYHGYENATIVFAVPGSKVNVKYSCIAGG